LTPARVFGPIQAMKKGEWKYTLSRKGLGDKMEGGRVGGGLPGEEEETGKEKQVAYIQKPG